MLHDAAAFCILKSGHFAGSSRGAPAKTIKRHPKVSLIAGGA